MSLGPIVVAIVSLFVGTRYLRIFLVRGQAETNRIVRVQALEGSWQARCGAYESGFLYRCYPFSEVSVVGTQMSVLLANRLVTVPLLQSDVRVRDVIAGFTYLDVDNAQGRVLVWMRSREWRRLADRLVLSPPT